MFRNCSLVDLGNSYNWRFETRKLGNLLLVNKLNLKKYRNYIFGKMKNILIFLDSSIKQLFNNQLLNYQFPNSHFLDNQFPSYQLTNKTA